jgi:hypothetical protein
MNVDAAFHIFWVFSYLWYYYFLWDLLRHDIRDNRDTPSWILKNDSLIVYQRISILYIQLTQRYIAPYSHWLKTRLLIRPILWRFKWGNDVPRVIL